MTHKSPQNHTLGSLLPQPYHAKLGPASEPLPWLCPLPDPYKARLLFVIQILAPKLPPLRSSFLTDSTMPLPHILFIAFINLCKCFSYLLVINNLFVACFPPVEWQLPKSRDFCCGHDCILYARNSTWPVVVVVVV